MQELSNSDKRFAENLRIFTRFTLLLIIAILVSLGMMAYYYKIAHRFASFWVYLITIPAIVITYSYYFFNMSKLIFKLHNFQDRISENDKAWMGKNFLSIIRILSIAFIVVGLIGAIVASYNLIFKENIMIIKMRNSWFLFVNLNFVILGLLINKARQVAEKFSVSIGGR